MKKIGSICFLSIFFIAFINFSPLPSSNISFSMIGFLLCLLYLIKNKEIHISQESILFLFFISCLLVSQIINSENISMKYFTQIANILLIFLCFISFNSLATFYGKDQIYIAYFKYGLIVCNISFIYFIATYLLQTDESLKLLRFFNNSGNYTATGVALWGGNFFSSVRMNLFFPEPSFFSMYIATLIGVGIFLGKQKKIIFLLIFFLFLTVGRTGILAFFVLVSTILFNKIFNPNRIFRAFIGVALLIFPIFLYLALFSFLTAFDYSFFQRIDSINNSINFFYESFIFGHGFETYNNYVRSYGYHSGDIFNFPLNIAVAGGIVSLISFAMFLFVVFLNSSKDEFPMLCSIVAIMSTIPSINIYFIIMIMSIACSLNFLNKVDQ